jgi:hypothetical protein
MPINDLIGYLACTLVFFTFYQKSMLPLRVTALLSNIAFIIYATQMHLLPIAILHGLLLPINISRLLPLLFGPAASLPTELAHPRTSAGPFNRQLGT